MRRYCPVKNQSIKKIIIPIIINIYIFGKGGKGRLLFLLLLIYIFLGKGGKGRLLFLLLIYIYLGRGGRGDYYSYYY